MDLVVDANILFAILIRDGKTAELIFHDDLKLYAPEFIFEEFRKYSKLILKKTSRTYSEFEETLSILQNRIRTVQNSEIEKFIKDASRICPDSNDVDYFASALRLKCAIWSNDKELKEQDIIKIYSTEELVRLFLN